MPNNTIALIDEALEKLATEKSIEAGLVVASHVLAFAGVGGLKSNDPSSADYTLLTALKLPNAERYDHWFQAHPKFKSNRACFALNDVKQSNIEAKFYALKTKKKMYISGAVHFTSNFEDAQFTRQDPNAKVGVDFFLPPSNDSLLIVVSNNKSLRVVELKDRLTNTQRDIFAKWFNVAALDREQLHLTIWESFKLKSINEAFYKGVADKFKEIVSHLKDNGKNENEARHFANRLLGRLLFCWFLDKKGFINRDVDYFKTTHTDATQYYQDKLELLFFDTLNTPQSERERSHPDQKTPYLNGGLFEAQPDDWRGTNVPFPQGFFVRLYEHFGEFNFTTDESTPDYEQIAIDPEMLGKIFENLLAEINEDTGEQARKAKGAFYTPREIVAYMCRESVREYLYTATKAGDKAKTSIDKLLDTSDSDWAKSGTNSKRDAVEPALREKIVKALDEMKVLDPACGSGAFPIGMLHLLVQIYERLDARFDPYKTKLGIMERNIYGVDIEPLAIEIARLRSFLALVVDQEYVEKKPNGGIDTLPNLEFKFVCANTLIPLTKQNSLGDSGKYETLLEIKREYFKATPKQREKLETKYNTLRQQGTMFDSRLNEQLQTYDPFNNDHPAAFYDQHLMHDITDSFSVTIGNPPYVQLQKNKGALANLYEPVNYQTFARTGDLYALFYEHGLELTKKDTGLLCYITSNKWMRAGYGEKLRSYFASKDPVLLIDFGGFKVFDSATVDTNILLIRNGPYSGHTIGCHMKNDFIKGTEISSYVIDRSVQFSNLGRGAWYVSDGATNSLQNKIDAKATELSSLPVDIIYGIKTGYNDAFIIDEDLRNKLITDNAESNDFIFPLIVGRDISRYNISASKKRFIILVSDRVDVKKFKLVFAHLKNFFTPLSDRAQVKRGDHEWYAVDNCPSEKVINAFKKDKIVWGNISYKNSFALSANGEVLPAPGNILISNKIDIAFLLGIFNSKLFFWQFKQVGIDLGKAFEWKKQYLKKIKVFNPLNADKQEQVLCNEIAKLARTISSQSTPDKSKLETEIDELVYQLYNLTPDEIALIEESVK